MKIIHITTGDLDGIGLEVSVKALNELGPTEGVQFVLWRSSTADKTILNLTDKHFNRISIKEAKQYAQNQIEKRENILVDIASPLSPTQWVIAATSFCLKNAQKEMLVTGPLSKIQMQKEGFQEKGHTDLLKKLSHTNNVFMTFLGEYFNVTLLTGHIPLKKIKWNPEDLKKCIELCLKLKQDLPTYQQNKKVGLLGLNPHAGEDGLLGNEEFLLKKELKNWKNKVEGPLVPDVAFLQKNQKKYFIYICLYHDQALIPFKMRHEKKSFHLSLGLPFIRTSVSHGTAKDIFGGNKADAQSMKQALLWAIHSHQQ